MDGVWRMLIHTLGQPVDSSSLHCLSDLKEIQRGPLIIISWEALWRAPQKVNINLFGIKCVIQEDEKHAPPHTRLAQCATKIDCTSPHRPHVLIFAMPQSVIGCNLSLDIFFYKFIPVFNSQVWPWIKIKSKADKLMKTPSSRLFLTSLSQSHADICVQKKISFAEWPITLQSQDKRSMLLNKNLFVFHSLLC